MKLILTHVNSKLPDYIWYNFENMRIWNPDVDIKIICHEQYQTQTEIDKLKEYDVELVPYEDLINSEIETFIEISWYNAFGKPNTKYPSPPLFVQGTSERLYALNSYLQQTNIKDIIHVENDVMIYEDLNKLLPIIKSCYDKLTITPMADKDHTFAFTYIPNKEEIDKFCQFNTESLKLGNDSLIKKYKMDMVHEMSIAKVYRDYYDGVDFFPVLPYGPYSSNYQEFKSLFDPASYGQYIGGTNNHGNGVGYAGKHHIIGKEILNGNIRAKFNGKYPETHNGIKINNLHVHSKQLNRFITNE